MYGPYGHSWKLLFDSFEKFPFPVLCHYGYVSRLEGFHWQLVEHLGVGAGEGIDSGRFWKLFVLTYPGTTVKESSKKQQSDSHIAIAFTEDCHFSAISVKIMCLCLYEF